ncbi:MAG TPA: ABC transporter substrate-binding protein [Candidatus Solibacter sp.]|nr:ABC transporter substrate-binding protein [Candidatus Solibacter sp.]
MKRIGWLWLVVSSALLASLAAETRPQYGGTLHVAMRTAVSSLDPADTGGVDSFARRSLMRLMFDTLVTMDESGRVQGWLATSWQASGPQRLQLRLRRGITFHDGNALTAEAVAASLRSANPSWNISVDSDSVTIEHDNSDSLLLAELALARNAIEKKMSDGKPSGTGPFQIAEWQPGKKLTLTTAESCWRGRPFLDAIEIEMGKNYRDQMLALESGKAEFIEVAAEQFHRVSVDGREIASSAPMELTALLFSREATSPDDKALREALAYSVERNSIRSVLLQGAGQPAGSLLPNWMTGYAFTFSAEADLNRARHAHAQTRSNPTWTLAYDPNDTVARLLAERIALNARDAGVTLQPSTNATADLRLVRIPLASANPSLALTALASATGLSVAKTKSDSVEALYASEQALLATRQIVPLFHLPASYAASARVKGWTVNRDGSWSLADAWLENRQP